MNCSLPAPSFYVSMMHNVHFISTPIYAITLFALFREPSKLFQTYKYFIIVHVFTYVTDLYAINFISGYRNLISEAYVTFGWLPITYLPYDVYRTTGWLADWGVSGILQFYILAQSIIVIGVSILEMFHHRFKVVVLRHSTSFLESLPTYGLYIFRIFALAHFITMIWSTIDSNTLVYQKQKKDALFRKYPNVPKELGCHSVFILAPEDPILMINCGIYGVLVCIGSVIGLSTVVFINLFLTKARNLSKETKKLQRMLIFSLLVQGAIHVVMIVCPIFAQLYQMMFIMYDNDLSTLLLLCVAYHGFFSTCAMVVFTKQLRQRILNYFKCSRNKREPVKIVSSNQIGGISTYVESQVK
uniref:Serpentine Receptor, class T n=1 Tax=Caenorhabditis tropicalis TaxID=1561998 RepID=A0A1I7TRH2_9PELO